MSRLAKVLWVVVEGENPSPFLCVNEATYQKLVRYDFFDLESGNSFSLFEKDLAEFVTEGDAYWEE